MKTNLFDIIGKVRKTVELSDDIFSVEWNEPLVHQVVVSIASNKRSCSAHTKDRSEVRGGGRKPHQQKGTGRARHGSRRSPIWAGGGVTFGPRNEKKFVKKINRKMQIEARNCVLSRLAKDNNIVCFEPLEIDKTRDAVNVLKKVGETYKGIDKEKVLMVLPTNKGVKVRAFDNLKNVDTIDINNINAHNLINHRRLVFVDAENILKDLE